MGSILLALSMTFAGMLYSFLIGWSFTLMLLPAIPFFIVSMSIMIQVLQEGFQLTMKTYS